jgi:transaldolase
MGEGSFYDQEMAALAKQGNDGKGVFEKMALTDIRAAAKDMAPVAEATGGVDGRVSFEVSPDLARDTDETYNAATRLYRELGLPNVLIKIPATAEGVPAIRRSIASGVSVNVTLIFSIARYREVMEAYLAGLEELAEAGGDVAGIQSVASFFISRVDSNVDKKLQAIVDEGGPDAEKAKARLGTTAIDNGKLAYEAFQQTFSGPRWDALASKGAHVQRPLWASTSTKNPDFRDVLYVEELIAPHTVNTMPLETIEAFQDHGEVRGATATQGMDRAHALWSDLAALGIEEATVGKELEDEGVEKFYDSYNDAIETVENKAKQL